MSKYAVELVRTNPNFDISGLYTEKDAEQDLIFNGESETGMMYNIHYKMDFLYDEFYGNPKTEKTLDNLLDLTDGLFKDPLGKGLTDDELYEIADIAYNCINIDGELSSVDGKLRILEILYHRPFQRTILKGRSIFDDIPVYCPKDTPQEKLDYAEAVWQRTGQLYKIYEKPFDTIDLNTDLSSSPSILLYKPEKYEYHEWAAKILGCKPRDIVRIR